jgi:hypothetical protein
MSYDLYFLRESTAPALTMEEVARYFDRRRHYRRDGSQFFYENEDTGVYFSFDMTDTISSESDDEVDEAPIEDGFASTGLVFNINYYRPHFFGLEAEPELSAIVGELGLAVEDAQIDGMGRGPYRGELFLRGWNKGNLFAYKVYAEGLPQGGKPSAPPTHDVLPAKSLERMWKWNFDRARLQEALGESVFVPSIRLIRHQGRVCSVAVWTDGIPEALPPVDYLVLVRDELAKRSFFRRRSHEVCLVTGSQLQEFADLGERIEGETAHLLLRYVQPPERIVRFFREATMWTEKLDGVAWDHVLTAEVMEQARNV